MFLCKLRERQVHMAKREGVGCCGDGNERSGQVKVRNS
jgi:hypothetical protein